MKGIHVSSCELRAKIAGEEKQDDEVEETEIQCRSFIHVLTSDTNTVQRLSVYTPAYHEAARGITERNLKKPPMK